MTDDDIRERAREAARDIERKAVTHTTTDVIEAALRAERERCARIAEERVKLARTLAPEAAWAVFEALPDALKMNDNRGKDRG